MRKSKRLTRRYVARQQKIAKKRVKRIRQHPFVVPVITLLVLFFVTLSGIIAFSGQTIGADDSRIVTVSIDGNERTVPTRASSVKDLLGRLNIDVAAQDLVEPKVETPILEDGMQVRVYRAKPVTVVDGNRKVTIVTAHQQPRLAVEAAGFKLSPDDGIITNAPTNPTEEAVLGQKILIDRSVAVHLNLYGNVINLNTRADTVKDLLDEKNIQVQSSLQVVPSLETKIIPDLTIVVVQTGKVIEVIEEDIPAATETVADDQLPSGQSRTVQEGRPGKKVVTYEITDTVARTKRPLQEFIAVQPVKTIIAKGTKVIVLGTRGEWLAAAGISPADYSAVDYIISQESGWCPTKWQGEYGGCPAYHGTPSTNIGYGLCQSTPGSKMASAGADWGYNPVTQLRWCTGYAKRYGGWQGAANFWRVNHWW